MTRGTRTKIAHTVGVTPKFIGDILTLRRRPSRKLSEKLEAATGIDRRIWVFEPERLRALLDEKYKAIQEEA